MPKRQRPSEDGGTVAARSASFGQAKRSRHAAERAVARDRAVPLGRRRERATLEGALSEELLVRIMSFLDVTDVVTMARVSSAWYRLAQEPQLWRSLYLSTYAKSRAAPPPSPSPFAKTRPWRELYKISTNWRRGTAKPTLLQKVVRQAVLPPGPQAPSVSRGADHTDTQPLDRRRPSDPETILRVHHHFLLSAPTVPTEGVCEVHVHQIVPNDGPTLLLGTFSSASVAALRPRERVGVTEIRFDDKPSDKSSLKVAVFYSNGRFAIFRLDLPTATMPLAVVELYTSPAPSHAAWADKIVSARLFSPLLVTFSATYTLRFYRMFTPSRPGAVMELHEIHASLRAQEMWWPAVLTLERARSSATISEKPENPHLWPRAHATPPAIEKPAGFVVTLAYATPLLQRRWTVGMQQFDISSDGHALLEYRTLMPPTGTGGGGLVTALEHRGRYLIASRADNTLDTYELVDSTQADSDDVGIGPARLWRADRLVHRKTLFGHTAQVCSVALDSAARAVSGGADGAIKVWDLDPAGHVEAVTVRPEIDIDDVSDVDDFDDASALTYSAPPGAVKQVMFDEAKIVSIIAGSDPSQPDAVKLLRFD